MEIKAREENFALKFDGLVCVCVCMYMCACMHRNLAARQVCLQDALGQGVRSN